MNDRPRIAPLYTWLSRRTSLSYPGKILITAFLGTHVPLLVLAGWLAFTTAPSTSWALTILGVALASTLVGTGITLWCLNALLTPIHATSEALHAYLDDRTPPDLPVHHTDEVGRLMADAVTTLRGLESAFERGMQLDMATGLLREDGFAADAVRVIEESPRAGWGVAAIELATPAEASAWDDTTWAEIVAAQARRIVDGPVHTPLVARSGHRLLLALVPANGVDFAVNAILKSLRQPLPDVSPPLHARPRAGVAMHPDDGQDPAQLVERARSVLARESDTPVSFWEEASHDRHRSRQALLADLRQALEDDALDVHLQPIVGLLDGRPAGFEALVRWNHPEHGPLSPATFLPLAEDADLMPALGDRVLQRACRDLATLRARGHRSAYVSVNLSPSEVAAPNLVQRAADAIARADLPPEALVIEVTEVGALDDLDAAATALHGLRRLGVRVALDDFGTGHSSLARLAGLPIDVLKLDRAFLADAGRAEGLGMLKGIVEIARGLDVTLVVEGVETEEHRDLLVAFGVRYAQGWLFARPAPVDDIPEPAVVGRALADTTWA